MKSAPCRCRDFLSKIKMKTIKLNEDECAYLDVLLESDITRFQTHPVTDLFEEQIESGTSIHKKLHGIEDEDD